MMHAATQAFQTGNQFDSLLAHSIDLQSTLIARQDYLFGLCRRRSILGREPVKAEKVPLITSLHAGLRRDGQIEILGTVEM